MLSAAAPLATPPAYAVLNIPCTHILGTFATEADAEAFNAGDPGAFIYELSAAESRALTEMEMTA